MRIESAAGTIATDALGVLAVVLLCLVVYGFRRYVNRPRVDPIDFIGTGIWILALTKAARLVFWDLVPDAVTLLGGTFTWSSIGVTASGVNWVFNASSAIGAWFLLHGYFLIVDRKEPGQYSTLTAVFYPRRLNLWIVSRTNGDGR